MKIESVEINSTAVRISQYPETNLPEFLLVGRSNVGKSSFINALIQRKNYARTSSKPGKTQALNFYLVNNSFHLVDVPGYGYARVSKSVYKKFGLMIEEYIKNRKSLKNVFMLIDYRHKPTEDDKIMYDFLKYYKLPVTIVATKYDKVSPSKRVKTEKILTESLKLQDNDKLVFFSSVSKKGREEIYSIINSFLEESN